MGGQSWRAARSATAAARRKHGASVLVCKLPTAEQVQQPGRPARQRGVAPRRTCANTSHLVGGRGLGMGFSRGSTVAGAGRCAMRPTGAASEGSANRRAASDWKMVWARWWQAASVAAGPPANAAASMALTSQAIRLPRSRASGPSCASLQQWAQRQSKGVAGGRAQRRRRRAADERSHGSE